MTLEDLGNLGDFLGAIGVIATLVYLAVQIRQNTKSVRASTFQDSTRMIVDVLDQLTIDPELQRIWFEGIRDFESLSLEDRRRFAVYMTGVCRRFEGMYYQGQQGLLDPSWWEGTGRNFERSLSEPGTQRWWEGARNLFHPEFQTFVDGVIERSRAS